MAKAVYKIRNKNTGLFSRGGTRSDNLWNKQGKTWSNIGHLKNHLNQYTRYNRKEPNPYLNAEIIEIKIDYDNFPRFDVAIIYDEMERKREFDEKQAEEKFRQYREKLERQQLEELKKKYEGESHDKMDADEKVD